MHNVMQHVDLRAINLLRKLDYTLHTLNIIMIMRTQDKHNYWEGGSQGAAKTELWKETCTGQPQLPDCPTLDNTRQRAIPPDQHLSSIHHYTSLTTRVVVGRAIR